MAEGLKNPFVRQVASSLVLTFFLIFILVMGITEESRHLPPADELEGIVDSESIKFPDFSRVIHNRTIDDGLDLDAAGRRVLIIGDIHGKNASLTALLNKLEYNSPKDLLIHTGDIISKSPLKDSLAVLDLMASSNATGVRGNHDQAVIEWRGWIDRVLASVGGQRWLERLERLSKKEQADEVRVLQGKKSGKKGETLAEWKRIPKQWEFMDDHYHIARQMTQQQYDYLLSLPLVLHIPRLHAFIVHAGLLPLDPRRSVTSQRQPLSHIPHSPSSLSTAFKSKNITLLRTTQERAVLASIPQNADPWSLLNMRGIKSDNTITKSTSKGAPWSDLWNSILERCAGYDDFWSLEEKEKEKEETDVDLAKAKKLPCYPTTVVYGHAASRGLDIKRWSKGLDTGCVYNRKLTALVLSPPSSNSLDYQSSKSKVKFGEDGMVNAHLVDVKC